MAIAGEAVNEVAGALDTAFDAGDPPALDEVLGAAFLAIERVDAEQGFARLAVQVWGEAVRSPALAEIIKGEIGRVRDAPPEQVAQVPHRPAARLRVPARPARRRRPGRLPRRPADDADHPPGLAAPVAGQHLSPINLLNNLPGDHS